eukprot:117132_1
MSQTVSESNRQGIVRLMNICNNKHNSNMGSKHQKKVKVRTNDDISKIIAEIGLNHANQIINIASKYAYYRIRPTLKDINADKKRTQMIKIEPFDILNAISYLDLPLSPQITLKLSDEDKKQSLNLLFLESSHIDQTR